uniref:E8 n=1 Tax=Human papillomavirus type 16 TaxID=333760 RepID=A0A7D7GWB0_HPV16|nr:E8 [Human papillomavirus 16]
MAILKWKLSRYYR